MWFEGIKGAGVASGRSVVPIPVQATDILFSPKRPDQLCGRSSLLFNGYRGCLRGVKRPRREANHSSVERRGYKSVEPYF